jgi:hypothetical protein
MKQKEGVIRSGRMWLLVSITIILIYVILITRLGFGVLILGCAGLIGILTFFIINRLAPPTGNCEFCRTVIKQTPKSTVYTICPKCHARLKWIL